MKTHINHTVISALPRWLRMVIYSRIIFYNRFIGFVRYMPPFVKPLVKQSILSVSDTCAITRYLGIRLLNRGPPIVSSSPLGAIARGQLYQNSNCSSALDNNRLGNHFKHLLRVILKFIKIGHLNERPPIFFI